MRATATGIAFPTDIAIEVDEPDLLRTSRDYVVAYPRHGRPCQTMPAVASRSSADRPRLAARYQARRLPRPGAAGHRRRAALHPQRMLLHRAIPARRGGHRSATGAFVLDRRRGHRRRRQLAHGVRTDPVLAFTTGEDPRLLPTEVRRAGLLSRSTSTTSATVISSNGRPASSAARASFPSGSARRSDSVGRGKVKNPPAPAVRRTAEEDRNC